MLATIFLNHVIITLWLSGEREEEGKGDVMHGDQPLVSQAHFDGIDKTATD